MKRFIPLIIVILILIGIGIGVLYYQRQEAVKNCKEECKYIPYETQGFRSPEYIETNYWRFGEYPRYKKFETQDQCIDYCLTVK